MLDLRTLRYFVQIAELRSFSQAARRLHVAQPSLTRQIHNLEEDLATPLFSRGSRGVTLTEAGELLLDHALRLLRDADRAYVALREHGADPSGQVLLGLPPTLGPVLLPQLITRLKRQYPRVVLDVVPSRNITIVEALLSGRVDVAVMAQVTPEPDLLVKEIAHEEMVLLTGPRLRKPGPITARELRSLSVVGTESLLAIANELLRSKGVHLQIELVLNNLDAVREMVRQSMCCTIFPYAIVRQDHQAGLVAAHRVTPEGLRRRLAIGTSSRRPQTGAMQAVMGLCQAITAEVEAANGFVL
jgi:LysR family transcriptional regulator, nitrogen assimilation regulatory protein